MDIANILTHMTLEEKCRMLSGDGMWFTRGCERLGVPRMMMTDGPYGLRKQEMGGDHLDLQAAKPAVAFPAACATACSFDPALLHTLGEALAQECQAEDIGMLLGPGVNIKRSPLCGRNFEYFSEDPYLSGELAAAYIDGLQSGGVGASLKHFALNNQETRRMSVSASVSERALHEIYLPAFERAVRDAKPWSVMCSYNKIDGVYASENPWLLRQLLREEWDYKGCTVTDWGACNDHVRGVNAGMDLEMPSVSPDSGDKLIQAVQNGDISEERVNEAAARVLALVDKYVQNRRADTAFDRGAHHHLARRIARECAVLLKNEGDLLPLSSNQKVVFIGEFAQKPHYEGGGSSHVTSAEVTSALDAVRGVAHVTYARGYDAAHDEPDEALLAEAIEDAKDADAAVLFVGLPDRYESEGYDRAHMRMPQNQLELIERVCAVNARTVIVLHSGAPVEMPFADQARAILALYLAGDACGGAAVDLLYGACSPCGKLAESWPYQVEDNPSYLNFPGRGDNARYAEDVYVGYRYYDKKKMAVRYPFGFGLSYTRFRYDNLRLSADTLAQDGTLTAAVDITNTGDFPAKEIAQLYVACAHAGVDRPLQELKGFQKIFLAPGETGTVSFRLTARDFAYWEELTHAWRAEGGAYEIRIGASSRDIRLTGCVTLQAPPPLPMRFNMDSTIGDILDTPQGASLIAPMFMQAMAGMGIQPAGDALGMGDILRMMRDMPLHAINSFTRLVAPEQLEALLSALNQPL